MYRIASIHRSKNLTIASILQHSQGTPSRTRSFHHPIDFKPPLRSELRLPCPIIFVLSSLVTTGIWFAYENISGKRSSDLPFSSIPTSTRQSVLDNYQNLADASVEQSISKEFNGSQLVVEKVTPKTATERLRQNERSYVGSSRSGISRYDVTQLASNSPMEDDYVQNIISSQSPSANGDVCSDWAFWGLFDGHSGWSTAAKLRQALISFVTRELDVVYRNVATQSTTKTPTPGNINAAIKNAFLRLDYQICHENARRALEMKSSSNIMAVELLAPANAGACALLSFYDCKTGLLRVACTGDSRAVLGRRGTQDDKWSTILLSKDQTGRSPSEIARIRKEHPGEEHITKRGRVLGLQPSRAFGDAMYKWDRETASKLRDSLFGKPVVELSKTPPYVTAEPVITTTKIQPGDFLVMGTDGLWECLSNEEVVGLVGKWLQSQTPKTRNIESQWSASSDENELPVKNRYRARPYVPFRQGQWSLKDGDDRFVVEDGNAATHILRNALGADNTSVMCALLSIPSPHARRLRDDITIQVVFFN